MPDSKPERLAAELDALLQAAPDVDAALLASREGLPLVSALPDDTDMDRVASQSATLLSLAEDAATVLHRGEMRQLFVEGEQGFVFVMAAGDRAVLSAVTARIAGLGPVLLAMRRSAGALAIILAEPDHEPVPKPVRSPASSVDAASVARELAALGLSDSLGSSMPDLLDDPEA